MTNQTPIPFVALADGPARGPHVALVTGADAPILTLELPDGLRGPAREDVARRQMRDRCGVAENDVELRPFYAPKDRESWNRVLVADAARLADWRAQAGTGCRAVLPDYLALPAAPGIWVLREEDGVVQARLGLDDGFSADPDLARFMLEQALDIGPAPKALFVQDQIAWAEDFARTHDIAVLRNAGEAQEHGLPEPVAMGHGELAFDLRADPRAARDRLARQVLPWRWPVLAGLLAVGLWAASQLTMAQNLEMAERTLREETIAEVRTTFVPTGPVLDVRAQVSRALADRLASARAWQGRVSPLTLFAQAAEIIFATDAGSDTYAYNDAELRVVLRMADFSAAESLVSRLRDAGLAVEVEDLSVNEGEQGVRAELTLEAGS